MEDLIQKEDTNPTFDRDAKTKIITLASTLQIEMAKIRLQDESTLSKARRKPRDQMEKTLRSIMDARTVGVVDPGPYSFLREGGKVDWKKILSGDQIDAMLKLRMFSYREGDKILVPDIECRCKSTFSWEVDILKDLRYQPLPDDSIERLKNDTPFEVEIDGHTVLFCLSTGMTEGQYRKLVKQHKGDRDMACILRSRIIDVVLPDGDKMERREIMDWLDGNNGASKKYEGLLSDDAEMIRDEMDKVDGGVDLEVEAICPEPDCGVTHRFDLPFDGIFLPGINIQRRKIQRRGQESLDA